MKRKKNRSVKGLGEDKSQDSQFVNDLLEASSRFSGSESIEGCERHSPTINRQ